MTGVELIIAPKLMESDLIGVDILFFNRVISNTSIDTVCKLRDKYGFKMVADFDDHWRLGPDHILYDSYKNLRVSEIMEGYIEVSDAVFVTHERLYKSVLPINKNVHILPNSIPKWGQFSYPKVQSEKTRLFWAGGVTHKKDLALLKEPIKRINRPGVQWVIGGYVKDNKEWQAMASIFTNGGRFDNNILESLPVDNYYACYSHCDISLIPLVGNDFNSHKSNLKVLEAANIAAPVIVSKVDPYLGFPEQIVNYVERQGDWFKHADRLLKNPGEAKEQGERLKEYCDTTFNFERINAHRKQIFDSLCHQKTGANLNPYVTSLLHSQVLQAK